MKIDNRYIVNINDDNTKTIFDLDTQQFFKLNRIILKKKIRK